MTITRYRKGQLSVPLLYVPLIDTLSGDMQLYRAGASLMTLQSSYVFNLLDIRLGTNRKIRDSGLNILMGGDNVGHINALGRIDCDVLTDPEKFKQTIDFVSTNYSGGQINAGPPLCWIAGATVSVKGYIQGLMPFRRFGGKTKITKITLWYSTNLAGAYITASYLYRITKTGAVEVAIINDTADKSNGTTGDTSAVWVVDEDLEEGYYYWYQFDAVVPAGTVFFYGLTFEGESVTP